MILHPLPESETGCNKKLNNNIIDKIKSLEPNVYISNKDETEDESVYRLEERLYGVDKITLMNFAGTTFSSSLDIASSYRDDYSKWFKDKLINGGLEAEIILTNPRSSAAEDAALYKMFPDGKNVGSKEIITRNINTLLKIKRDHKNAKISIRLTDMALPYGIMYAKSYHNRSLEYMKIDIYAGMISDDGERPSFYIYRRNQSTSELFNFFKRNIDSVKSNSRDCTSFLNLGWIQKHNSIIHRGLIDRTVKEHSITAFYKCIYKEMPIEIDLLFLDDGSIIVGRDYDYYNIKTKKKHSLRFQTLNGIRQLKTVDYMSKDGGVIPFSFEETMTFMDFLELVNGKVPLLIEIKMKYDAKEAEIDAKIKEVIRQIRYYKGEYAFHSANPNVLSSIKKHDELIPCGQITWDFNGVDVSDEYRRMHQNLGFLPEDNSRYIYPDFLSCKVQEMASDVYVSKVNSCCKAIELKTGKRPLVICWTVRNISEQKIARRFDNQITELYASEIEYDDIQDRINKLIERVSQPLFHNVFLLADIIKEYIDIVNEILVFFPESYYNNERHIKRIIKTRDRCQDILNNALYPELNTTNKEIVKREMQIASDLIDQLV